MEGSGWGLNGRLIVRLAGEEGSPASRVPALELFQLLSSPLWMDQAFEEAMRRMILE